ncbi:MAG: alpha-E domain-containing protein [Gammaproteobacteria bacterium]
MLSRVAERVYWLGRYLERIENTARLINVYGNVLLDLPRPAKLVWESLVAITGSQETFGERYSRADERNVVKFYLADRSNPTSVLNSATYARENARTVREIVPANTWEAVNDLFLYIHDNVEGALARRGRDVFLTHVINSCQFVIGSLAGTMSRDAAYQFLRAGRYLERGDMTSRIVDVGAANVFPWVSWMHGGEVPEGAQSPYESILWMSVLRSLSALQMYRRLVPVRVRADEVVTFLLQDEAFPRAIAHCLKAVQSSLDALPRDAVPVAKTLSVLRRVREANVRIVLQKDGLYDFIDQLQVEFSGLHDAIEETWFLPDSTLATAPVVGEHHQTRQQKSTSTGSAKAS